MEEANSENNEGESISPEESDEPSTISSEIRRCLGPLFDLGFIIVNRKGFEKLHPDPNHLSLLCPCRATPL